MSQCTVSILDPDRTVLLSDLAGDDSCNRLHILYCEPLIDVDML